MIKKGKTIRQPNNLYSGRKYSPIVALMRKRNLKYTDVCRVLCVGNRTLREYIDNPQVLRLHNLILLSGLFGIEVEVLVYLLMRNKPATTKHDKKYLGSIQESIKSNLSDSNDVSFLD